MVVAHSLNSKVFWHCVEQIDWPNFIDILSIIFGVIAIVINGFTASLLLRVKEGNRIPIVLLQTTIFNNIVDAIIKIIYNVVPFTMDFSVVELNYIFCVLWDSRFLFELFNSFSIVALILFSIDRALTIASKDTIRFTTVKSRLRTYLISIYLFGFLITAPQFLYVNLENGICTCIPSKVNVPVLSLIYAYVFVRFVLLVILNGAIFFICAGIVIRYVLQTPVKHQVDELNYLHFFPPSAVDLKRLEKSHSWKTPSLCILPIGITFVIDFGFPVGYQFISGLGLTTYVIDGNLQIIGTLMLALFSSTIPIVLLLMLPVFRFWLEDKFDFLKCCQRKDDISQQLSYSSDWYC